jgi:hypothetical protein
MEQRQRLDVVEVGGEPSKKDVAAALRHETNEENERGKHAVGSSNPKSTGLTPWSVLHFNKRRSQSGERWFDQVAEPSRLVRY